MKPRKAKRRQRRCQLCGIDHARRLTCVEAWRRDLQGTSRGGRATQFGFTADGSPGVKDKDRK